MSYAAQKLEEGLRQHYVVDVDVQDRVSLRPENFEGCLLRVADHIGLGEITTFSRRVYPC
jgi:hypothetical protein